MSELAKIDWDKEAPVMYHSAFEGKGFSREFRDAYFRIDGSERPDAWPHDNIRVDNKTSVQVVMEIGVEQCGRGLTVAVVPRRALPALRILDTDGCEYPDLDPDRFVVHYIVQHLKTDTSISSQKVADLLAEAKTLHLRIISRAHLSPGATTSNRYACLSL